MVINEAFAVAANEHLDIVVTPELYDFLLTGGWKENASGAIPPSNIEQHYRAHRVLNGEDFAALQKDMGIIDGIPVVNRLSHAEENLTSEALAA